MTVNNLKWGVNMAHFKKLIIYTKFYLETITFLLKVEDVRWGQKRFYSGWLLSKIMSPFFPPPEWQSAFICCQKYYPHLIAHFLPVLLFEKPGEGARYKDLMWGRSTKIIIFSLHRDRVQLDKQPSFKWTLKIITWLIISWFCQKLFTHQDTDIWSTFNASHITSVTNFCPHLRRRNKTVYDPNGPRETRNFHT